MSIIDFRYRPATREVLDSVALNPVYKKFCSRTPFRTQPVTSLPEAVQEMLELGVRKAVVTGRDIESTYASASTNEQVLQYMQHAPDLFLAFYGFDPHKGMSAVRALRDAVEEHGFTGAAMDPSMAHLPVSDRKLYPLYTVCCELGIPLVATTGLSPFMPGVVLSHTAPSHFDQVATDFPDLRLIISHACYPWVDEALAVAMRHDQVYLDFSAVESMPRVKEILLQAALAPLSRHKVLFSSASPFVHIRQALQFYHDLDLPVEAHEAIMYGNAATLLNLAE